MAGGGTVGDHLASVRRQMGREDRAAPELPRDFLHVWNAFVELHEARSWSQIGPNPLAYAEIAAYCHVTGVDLSPWEVKVIRALDSLYLQVTSQSG